MKSTTLTAVLIAHFGASRSYAQWDCRQKCLKINSTDPTNPCGPTAPSGELCNCAHLRRAESDNLFIHKYNSKIEIYHDNGIHMFCHNSDCYRDDACRITITYRNDAGTANNGDYELPAYDECCTFPEGYINAAVIHYIGY